MMRRRQPSPSATRKSNTGNDDGTGKLLGTVEEVDEREAIEKAAEEFKTDAAKLIAVRRR